MKQVPEERAEARTDGVGGREVGVGDVVRAATVVVKFEADPVVTRATHLTE